MRNGNNGRYLSQAKSFLVAAEREFVSGRRAEDDIAIRQAAEKAWGAAVQATNAILQRYGEKVRVGTTRKEDSLHRLEDRIPRLHEGRFGERFSTALHILHGRCFYEGYYTLDVVERQIRRVAEYIHDVAKLA